MSSREAARATSSTVSASAAAGIFSGSAPSSGSLGKSSAGRTRRWKLRAAAADLDVALGLAQLDLDLVVAERARELGQQAAGEQDRAGAGDLRLAAPSRSPISPSVAASVTPSSPALSRIPESACVAARVETARETIDSLETSSSRLVVSFK